MFHIRDVLNNTDRFFGNSDDRPRLRLIALIHDTFKYQAIRSSSATSRKSHAYQARKFAERYIDDLAILQVIELHDDAYRAWRCENREVGERGARELIAELGDHLGLFIRFYRCDSLTPGKTSSHYRWFEALVRAHY